MLAALVVAVMGVIPMAWLLTTPQQDPASQAATAATTAATTTSTTLSTPSTTMVVATVPELDVTELDASVVRVLQANGYAELTPESDVATELPPAVTRVLIDRGAVLTVVEGDPNAAGG